MLKEIEQIEKCGRKCFDKTHKESILKMKNKTIHLKFTDILKLRDGFTVKKGNIQLKRGD